MSEALELRSRRAEQDARHDPAQREGLQRAVGRWLDPPLMLASVLLLLLTLIQVTTPLSPGKRAIVTFVQTAIWIFFIASYVLELLLAPDRWQFVRAHPWRLLTVVLPFFGFLRVLSAIRFAHIASYARLLLLSHRTGSPALEILRRRHLGQVALMSTLVVAISASLEYLVEPGTRNANIQNAGDALWWAATTLTTIGSPLYPVTTGGKIVALALMLYAVSVFTYFVASLASVLIGHDETKQASDVKTDAVAKSMLTEREVQVLRELLARNESGAQREDVSG